MSIIPQLKIIVKYYLCRYFIISIYANLKRQNYINKFKDIILIATYLFLCWKQFGLPRHRIPDDMANQVQESFHKAGRSALIITLLLRVSQLHLALLTILWKCSYFKTRKKKLKKSNRTQQKLCGENNGLFTLAILG